MQHILDNHNPLSEQLFTDVALLFETRKKLAERKANYLINNTGNDNKGNTIPQEYIDFCKAGVKVQLQVNNDRLLGEKIQQEILAPFSDGPNTGTAGFSRVGFEREISYPQSDIEQILLYGTLSDLETVWSYIDSLPAPLIARFNEYLTYKAYTPTTTYGVVYQSAIRLFRSLQNYITHTPKAKMLLSASKKNIQATLDLPNFSKLDPKQQALLLKKIQKALILPGSHTKIHACVALYQELLNTTTRDEKKDTQHTTDLSNHIREQSLPVSKQVMHSIISFIKNQKLAFGSMLLLIVYIAFADTLNEQIEEKVLITTQLPKQKPGLTGFPDQKTYDTTYDLFEDSISNPATQRALSIKNIASIDDMIDQLDASFDTLLTHTKRLEQTWIYSNNGYLETLSNKDSIQFREYITTLKEQSRQINKVLNVRTEVDSIDSYEDFLKKSQLITDGIIACVANDPASVNQLSKYKHPIAIDRKLGTENSLDVLLHELHHSIAPPHKYHSITEGTTEHSTQLAIEQILGSSVRSPTYNEEVINAVLLQNAFDDPELKQVNAFTGKQIIPGGKKISPEYSKQINAAANRENIQNMYDGLKNPEQKREMYDAIRYSRLKDYLNATKYTHPLLVLLVLPQDQINRSDREILPKDSYFPQEVPYNKTLRGYGIEPLSCSSHFWQGLYELIKSHPTLTTEGRTFTIEEFQTFDLETQRWLFYTLQESYLRSPSYSIAGFNLSKTKNQNGSTKAEEDHIDHTIEEAYEEITDNIKELSEKIQVSVLTMLLLSMLAFYGSYRRQRRTYKNTDKILQQDDDAAIVQIFLPLLWISPLVVYIQITHAIHESVHQDFTETALWSVMCLGLTAHQVRNILQQRKALREANKQLTLQITEKSDSLTLFGQLQKQQKNIHEGRISTYSHIKDTEYERRKTAFLRELDAGITYTSQKSFTNTIYENLITTNPSAKKQKTVSAPIITSQKSRYDVTHRDKMHPHSYIPGTQEAIVYTPEVEFHKERATNNETVKGKHFVIHFNLDNNSVNEITEGNKNTTIACFWALNSIIKIIHSLQEIKKTHSTQFTLMAYKNGLPVYTTLLGNNASFTKQLASTYLSIIESYEWSNLYDTPEVINIAQTDIRHALPKKREKNIFLGFQQHSPGLTIGTDNYKKAEYYGRLFKTLYTLPHQSYQNLTGIGDSSIQDNKHKNKNKKK